MCMNLEARVHDHLWISLQFSDVVYAIRYCVYASWEHGGRPHNATHCKIQCLHAWMRRKSSLKAFSSFAQSTFIGVLSAQTATYYSSEHVCGMRVCGMFRTPAWSRRACRINLYVLGHSNKYACIAFMLESYLPHARSHLNDTIYIAILHCLIHAPTVVAAPPMHLLGLLHTRTCVTKSGGNLTQPLLHARWASHTNRQRCIYDSSIYALCYTPLSNQYVQSIKI